MDGNNVEIVEDSVMDDQQFSQQKIQKTEMEDEKTLSQNNKEFPVKSEPEKDVEEEEEEPENEELEMKSAIPKRTSVKAKRRFFMVNKKSKSMDQPDNGAHSLASTKTNSFGGSSVDDVEIDSSNIKETSTPPKTSKKFSGARNRFGFRRSKRENLSAKSNEKLESVHITSEPSKVEDEVDATQLNGDDSEITELSESTVPNLETTEVEVNSCNDENEFAEDAASLAIETEEEGKVKQPKSLRVISWKKIVNAKILPRSKSNYSNSEEGDEVEDKGEFFDGEVDGSLNCETIPENSMCAAGVKDVKNKDEVVKKSSKNRFVKRLRKLSKRRPVIELDDEAHVKLEENPDAVEDVSSVTQTNYDIDDVVAETEAENDVEFERRDSFDEVLKELKGTFDEKEEDTNDTTLEQSDLTCVTNLPEKSDGTEDSSHEVTEDPAEITSETVDGNKEKENPPKLEYVLIDPLTEKPKDESYYLTKKALKMYKTAQLSQTYCRACCSLM